MRRPSDDFYAVLGVEPSASDEMIKAAFRARAKALHPDINPQRNSTDAFQRVQAAYAVLGNLEDRKRYDNERLAATIDPPAGMAEPAVDPVYKRWRFHILAGLAAVAVVVVILIYQSQSGLPFPSPGAARNQSGRVWDLSVQNPEMQAAITHYTANYSGPEPSATSEVEVEGRNGRKYVVSGAVAKKLEPMHNKLLSMIIDLNDRGISLKERRDNLERERQTLNASEMFAIRIFNEKMTALNHDVADFLHDRDLKNQALEAFYNELDRVALRSH